MKKLSKKQKLIGFIAIILVAVILAIAITENIVNRKIGNEGYLSTTANANSNLVAGYIKKGITIGGITGTLESLNTFDATAEPEDILWGKTGYVKGEKITGTRVNTVTLGKESQKVFEENTILTDDYGNSVKIPEGFKIAEDSATTVTGGVVVEDVSAGDNNTKNPFFDNLYIDRKKMTHTLNANIYAIVKLPFGLEYQMNFTPTYKWYEYYNHKSSKHPEWAGDGGESERTNQKTFGWLLDNIVRWKKEFGDHRLEATFLANAEKEQYWSTTAKNTQFSPSDILGYHNIGAGTVPVVSSEDKYKTGDALMGRLFYSYKDKYMITASVRRDGYSAFGQENPRATFPAIALGWVFTSEKFMEPTSGWLNYGKLRFSWGQNGNRDIGQYDALARLTSGLHPYYDINNGVTYVTSQIYVNDMENRQLKWERTASYNVGLDFSLFNDRLSGSMETYISETSDLLVDRTLPEIIGFYEVKANLGKLSNKGFELSLNGDIISTKDFLWTSSGTFSFNRRKLLHLYGDMQNVYDEDGNLIGQKEADDLENKWFIGHDPDQIWDYEGDGVWQLGEEEEAAKYGCRPGDFRYVDQNGDGVLNTEDKIFQGYKTPRFYWSWRNEFNYKDFSLSFMMYSHVGQYGTFNRAANSGNMYDRYTIVDIPRWTVDNPTNEYGRIASNNFANHYVKKTFVRMENITLSYSVPKTFLQRLKVQNMRLSLSVRNPFVLTSWNFGDVEGEDYTMKTYNLSINFTL